MKIGEAARAAGVKISTLRFYERRGLVRPRTRTAADHRLYTHDDVRRLQFVRRAHALGFTLEEIHRFLELSTGGTPTHEDVAQIGHQKLEDLGRRIADLERMRRALTRLLAGGCDPNAACPIIASLTSEEASG